MPATDRENYIYSNLGILSQKRLRQLTPMVVLLFLGFMFFDYLHGHLWKVLPYRIAICIFMGWLTWASSRSADLKYQTRLIALGAAAIAATINVIAFAANHHLLYGGMNLIVIGVLGFFPLDKKMTIRMLAIICGIFIVPIAIVDPGYFSSTGFRLMGAYFVATSTLAYGWRISHQQTLISWLGIQFDLFQDKQRIGTLLSEVFDKTMDGIVIMGANGFVKSANKAAHSIFNTGSDQLIHSIIPNSFGGRYRKVWLDHLARLNNETVMFEMEASEGECAKRVFEISLHKVTIDNELLVYVYMRDITDRIKAQEQMMASQKLKTAGAVACGMAHDFKNIATNMRGYFSYVKLAASSQPLNEHTKDLLAFTEAMENEVQKAEQVVADLADLGRPKKATHAMFDVCSAIADIADLQKRGMRHVKIDLRLPDKKIFVNGDKSLFAQAIINIILNASDAMRKKGRLTISVEAVGDKSAVVALTDTGIGIPQENLPFIFDPFYTTKPERKFSAGMGLTTAQKHIKDAGGDILVDSHEGRGTTVTVILPIASVLPLTNPDIISSEA